MAAACSGLEMVLVGCTVVATRPSSALGAPHFVGLRPWRGFVLLATSALGSPRQGGDAHRARCRPKECTVWAHPLVPIS
jgi:hypothetical protein